MVELAQEAVKIVRHRHRHRQQIHKMILIDYIIIAIFSLFLLSSKTRATASVLLFAYVPYYFVAMQLDGLQRYMVIGTIEIIAGCYLIYGHHITLHLNRIVNVFGYHQDDSIAETYFILVFFNVIGGVLYWYYFPKEYYGIMTLSIMIMQITILLWRVFKDGKLIGRCSNLYPTFGAFVSNINERYSFLQKKKIKS